jgi:hypothetical protein
MHSRAPASIVGVVTAEAALGLPSLRRGAPRVVAGREGLDRPIRWAHSEEVVRYLLTELAPAGRTELEDWLASGVLTGAGAGVTAAAT